MNLFKELKSGSAGKIQVGQSLHTMSTALKDNTTLTSLDKGTQPFVVCDG